MAELVPFRGVRFNPARVDLRQVVAPPYDVISPDALSELRRRHPKNIVHVDLPEGESGRDPAQKHVLGAVEFRDWLSEEVLVRDIVPSIYVYRQDYLVPQALRSVEAEDSAETRVLVGLIGAVCLEEFSSGVILPHEKTMRGPKEDRLLQMEASRSNMSCVFAFCSDDGGEMSRLLGAVQQEEEPENDFSCEGGPRQRMWQVSGTDKIRALQEAMEGRRLFIADGHHRYETALRFRDLERLRTPSFTGREGWNYVMMMVVALEGNGLTVLPVHRVVMRAQAVSPVRGDATGSASPAQGASRYFDVTPVAGDTLAACLETLGKQAGKGHAFGMYADDGRFSILTVREGSPAVEEVLSGVPREWRDLDVALLHALALDKVVLAGSPAGRVTEDRPEEVLSFTEDPLGAVRMVDSGEAVAAFFLNPTPLDQVKTVALAGKVMPHKSTFFYPKLLTGLVMRELDDALG